MAEESTRRVLDESQTTGRGRLVMLALAHTAEPGRADVVISLRALAHLTRLSPAGVVGGITEAAALGELTVELQDAGLHGTAPNRYTLALLGRPTRPHRITATGRTIRLADTREAR